jgi:hypothetical protein
MLDSVSKVSALVEFFAPIKQDIFDGLGPGLERLSPLEIHHGRNDQYVKPEQTEELMRLLEAAGTVSDFPFSGSLLFKNNGRWAEQVERNCRAGRRYRCLRRPPRLAVPDALVLLVRHPRRSVDPPRHGWKRSDFWKSSGSVS